MTRVACTIVSAIALTLFAAAALAGAQEANRKIVRSKPSTPVEIDGIPCASGHVFLEEGTGRLHQCRLDRDAVVRNAKLEKGTTVALNADGSIRYVFLPGTTMVGQHRCRGGGHDWMTHFHANGALKSCWLSRDEVVQAVPCSRATSFGEFFGRRHATTEFHDNGSLASCVASAATDVGGRRYAAGERVKLDPGGQPVPAR